MKTPRQILLTLLRRLCVSAASAALFCTPEGFAQPATITRINPPGSPASITGLNELGNVAGYYYDANSIERAFFWTVDGGSVDLGTLGGARSVAYGLNNFDQVVGYSSLPGETEFRGFIWTFGFMFGSDTLGGATSVATAISDASELTGYSYVSRVTLDYHAVRGFGAQWEDLGTLGGPTSLGVAINLAGQVAGQSTLPGGADSHAFLFDGRRMRDLGTLGGASSSAQGLNNNGWVAGDSDTAGNAETHAYVYDGAAMRDLGTLGGTYSMGFGINDAGQVIGDSTTSNDAELHGFIWSNGTMQDLGTLGGGFSTVWDLNNLGHIVGVSSNAFGQERAFVWQNGRMLDLNAILPANSGWELTAAVFINDTRQVVGYGLYRGQSAWYRLTVTDSPNQPPIAKAGNDQTVECTGSTTPVTISGSASSDPDGDPLTFEWFEGTVLLGSASVLNVALSSGSHAIFLRVTDPSGATAEDLVVVNVVDIAPPVVQCPADLILVAGEDCGASVPDLLVNLAASDACTPAASLIKNQTPSAGTLLGVGTHPVTVTVADSSGNVTTCITRVTVTDRTPPVVQCPTDLILVAGEDCGASVPDFLVNLAVSDACTLATSLVKSQTPPAGARLGVGTHPVTITVTDTSGNVTACIVRVTVADQTAPVVQCPANLTLAAGEDCGASAPDFLANLVALDFCTPPASLVKNQMPPPGTRLGLGTHPVMITVTDAARNVTTCVVQATVADQIAPVVQCPGNVTVQVGQDGRATIPDFLASLNASDACTPAAQLTKQQVPSAGTSIGAGTQPVAISVADAAGNITTCIVQVMAGDRTAPIISSIVANPLELRPINRQLVPITITVEASDESDPHPVSRIISVSNSETAVVPSDNKDPDWVITGALTLKLRAENLSKDAPRIYTVTVACIDASGNQSIGSVTITAAKNRDFGTAELRGVLRRKIIGDVEANRYEKKAGGNKGSERSRR